MDDNEKNTGTTVSKETNASKTAETDKSKSKNKKDFSKLLKDTYHDYLGEFRKIVWPSRQDLVKKTVTVVITSLLFGLVIFVMDTIYSAGLQLFINLVVRQ